MYGWCRMLKQIVVTGTMDGEEIEHLYSYINFRPYIAPDEAFDVCVLAPKVRAETCESHSKADAHMSDIQAYVAW